MKYPVTPSKRTSVSVVDLSENAIRGRTRRRLSLEYLLGGGSSSTPVRGGPVQRKIQRSVSAGRRFSLGTSLVDLGRQDCSIHLPHGRFPSPHMLRSRSRSTTSEMDLDVAPASFITASSFADVSGVSDASVFSVAAGASGSCSNLRTTRKYRSRSNKFIGSVWAAAGTFTKRRSGSMVVISSPDVRMEENVSLNRTPVYTQRVEPEYADYDEFLPAEEHPDFTPQQNPNWKKKDAKRRQSFTTKSLFGARRKSIAEFKTPVKDQEKFSMAAVEKISKKRRASDINLRELFGGTARRFTRREKEPRIAEDSFDLRDLPDLRKLPMTKKVSKSPTTGVRVSPTRSLSELLKRKAGILRFRAFLQSEFSEENLDFWIECEAYKYQRLHKQRKLAPKIYLKYVAPCAPREVNLDAMTRRKTKSNIDCPDAKSFDLAQNKIFKLMERDSFKRFKESTKSKIQIHTNVPTTKVTQLTTSEFERRKISL